MRSLINASAMRRFFVTATMLLVAAVAQAQSLASWNDSPAKLEILKFVAGVTTACAPTFVPPAERIAVFDNGGTLWCEVGKLDSALHEAQAKNWTVVDMKRDWSEVFPPAK